MTLPTLMENGGKGSQSGSTSSICACCSSAITPGSHPAFHHNCFSADSAPQRRPSQHKLSTSSTSSLRGRDEPFHQSQRSGFRRERAGLPHYSAGVTTVQSQNWHIRGDENPKPYTARKIRTLGAGGENAPDLMPFLWSLLTEFAGTRSVHCDRVARLILAILLYARSAQ